MDDIQKEILDCIERANPDDPLDYVTRLVRPRMREGLDQLIRECDRCGRHCQCKSVTKGNPQASVMIICEGFAGNGEAGETEPLSNPKEQELMRKVWDGLGVNTNQLFWINAVNCGTSVNVDGRLIPRPPNGTEMRLCKDIVDRAIQIMQPVFIILLGNIPFSMYRQGQTVLTEHGKIIEVNGIPAMPVYSPSWLIRMEGVKDEDTLRDLQQDFCTDLCNAFLFIRKTFGDKSNSIARMEGEQQNGTVIFREDKDAQQG